MNKKSNITKEELKTCSSAILTDFANKKNLLVSFGGINQGLGIPVFEFFNSISDLDCDKIFIRDFNQAWYQKGIDEQVNSSSGIIEFLHKSIEKNNYKKVCFIGNSMGGYAAILFGTILKVNKVISFAPQSFINLWNKLLHSDYRWLRIILDLYLSNNSKGESLDLKRHLNKIDRYNTNIDIYYDSNHRLDRVHAERLRNNCNVHLFQVNQGGHSVVKTIRDNGKLREILEGVFSE